MKKALIHDPYFDTMGGGERYALTFAIALVKNDYSVDLAWNDDSILSSAQSRFNLNLKGIRVDPKAYEDLSLSSGLIRRFTRTRDYDLTFWVSDGSLPFLFSQKNFIHFQVPFTQIGGNKITNLAKVVLTRKLIFNSDFTTNVIKKQLPLASSVILYPPIDTDSFVPGKKENLILSVARFDSPSHAKRQDILTEAMRKLHEKNKTLKLILVGGLKGDGEYLTILKQSAGKLPIEFVPNPDFSELKKLYAKAKFFWHAAGYGINETLEPEKVEHFGITTVEAMSAGAIPIVINRGGQREIVTANTGYLCESIEEIVSSTRSLINSPEKLQVLARNAIIRSKDFSTKIFEQKVISIIS